MLEIEDLSGGWGPTLVIDSLSLRLARGQTLAVIGRNGVGKSTLLELVVGRARQRAGNIRLDGVELSSWPVYRRARAGVGYVPQSREVFPSLTVAEHLRIAARAGPWTVPRILEMFPRLHERAPSYGNQLSGGEQQMLAIARALLGNPKLLLMDEPFEGLAPLIVDFLITSIRQIVASDSVALLLVEQRVDIALELSQRCVVMDRGRAVHQAASADLAGQSNRIAQWMGIGAQES